MEITLVFYPRTRQDWRQWLERNHRTETEVWLQTFRKSTGKPSISYDEMVEESLCYGWIDGTVKTFDAESMVQRVSPRRKKSFLSELNRQRIWKLQAMGLMTEAGLEPVRDQIGNPDDPFEIPAWLELQLREDPLVWQNFQSFPLLYQRLKIGWITEVKGSSRQEEVQKRLNHLIKMTRQGKQYGSQPMSF